MRVCRMPGCGLLVSEGQRTCPTHRRTPSRTAPKPTIAYVLRRARGLCEQCGQPTPSPYVHHITPRREQGTHDPSNLIAVCHPCHSELEGWHERESARRSSVKGWGGKGSRDSRR